MAVRCLPVSVIACVGATLVVACGGRGGVPRSTPPHERAAASTDLRSPDVDGRMDPASSATVFACPPTRRVEVVFDPRGTVALLAGGRPLVYGTAGTRAVNRACRPQGSLSAPPKGVLEERNAGTRLSCAVPRSARFEVHPIGRGEVGSAVSVLVARLRRVVVSAVLDPRGSRIFYGRACRPR